MADDDLHGHVNAVEETQQEIQETHEEQASTEADRHVRNYTLQECKSTGRHTQVLLSWCVVRYVCGILVDNAHVPYW